MDRDTTRLTLVPEPLAATPPEARTAAAAPRVRRYRLARISSDPVASPPRRA